MANGTVSSGTRGQVSDVLPLLAARGRPSKAAKKLALEVAERQQQQQQAQLEPDQQAPQISGQPPKVTTKKGSRSKRGPATSTTQTVPGIADAAATNNGSISSQTSSLHKGKAYNVPVPAINADVTEPEASDDEAQPSIKVEMQRAKPRSPAIKSRTIIKHEVPADAPLPMGGHDDDIDSSLVDSSRNMPEQSRTRTCGVVGLAEETTASVVHGVGRDSQAQTTELGKLANEVKKWEVVTHQVAYETKELAKLVKDLSNIRSEPHRHDISQTKESSYREQLLKTAQLSIKADIVQNIRLRDAETHKQQVYCVLVFAGAIVLAAFLVSPFAEWVVDFMFWLLTLLG